MSLLRFDDVDITYASREGDVPAVRGVSLHVDAGETLGIAGESGCGKTTLTSSVLRLLPKTAKVGGRILLDDKDIMEMSFGELRAVRWGKAALVFQGAMHALNPVQRIDKQLAEPIFIHETISEKAAASRVGELLEQVGLPQSRATSYPHQLSGGQKQRVMIAMALACRPKLLIADEPTTALDVMVQAQILELLNSLVRELNLGVVFISHDLSVLSSSCDRIAVMYAGKIVEEGPAESVFDDSLHPYSRALAGAFPRIGDQQFRYAPAGLPGDPPFPSSIPPGCSFHPRCPVAIDRCSTEEPRLELFPPGGVASGGPSRQVSCHKPGEVSNADVVVA
jgi:peptide/nickel transport system ATP-binding protein